MPGFIEFDTDRVLQIRFIEPVLGHVLSGATAISATTFLTDLTDTTDDTYNGDKFEFTGGSLQGRLTKVTDYTGATQLIVIGSVGLTPEAGDPFKIHHLIDLSNHTGEIRWRVDGGEIFTDTLTIAVGTDGLATYKFTDLDALPGGTLEVEASVSDSTQLITTADRLTFTVVERMK